MNVPRAKGTMAETATVHYLNEHGWPYAERRALKGMFDQGDVTGTPGLCWEVKYANGGIRMKSWVEQTEVERLNSGSDHGILVIKPLSRGARSVASWYAVMVAEGHNELIGQARTYDQMFMPAPFTYTAGNLQVALTGAHIANRRWAGVTIEQMGSVNWETGNPASRFVAVTAVPRGCKDRPSQHYRVMYLEDMVRLLRQAGYGTPDADPAGVSRE